MPSPMHCMKPTAKEGGAASPAAPSNPSDRLASHMKYRTTDHSVYTLNYHIVLVTKYRNKVLFGAVETYLKEQMHEICKRYGWEILALECMSDHVHLFVSAPPKTPPMVVARTVKSILAVSIFRRFPGLKKRRFWGSGLWSRGTYYGSAGAISGTTIMRYIEKQKEA